MSNELEQRVLIASGYSEEENALIEAFYPLILKCVSKVSTSSGDNDNEDKISIAMIAFLEAIRSFDPERGRFITFATQVINRRLIDQLRLQGRYQERTLLFSGSEDPDDEDEEPSYVQMQIAQRAVEQHAQHEVNVFLSLEIAQFRSELEDWGISFADLEQQSPRHPGLRRDYREVVEQILHTPELLGSVILKRMLPIKRIAALTGFNEKKLDRGRKYIIACIIIAMGDYRYLSGYIGLET